MKYVYSNENHRYELENYNAVKEGYIKWLNETIHPEMVIVNDVDFKTVKNARTAVRKEIALIKGEYKACFDIVMGTLEGQKKELIKMLEEVEANLKGKIDEYKASKEEPVATTEEQVYEINYKTTNKEVYDKIMDFITQLEKEGNNQ